MGIYRKLFKYVPEKRHYAWLSLLLSLAALILQVAPIWFLWRFFEEVIVYHSTGGAWRQAVIIVGLLLAYALTYLLALTCSHLLAFRLENNLRRKAGAQLMEASFSYFDTHTSGRIRKVIDDNAAQIHMIVAHLIPDLTVAIGLPVVLLMVAAMVDWRFCVLLIIMILFGLGLMTMMMGGRNSMTEYMKSLEAMNAAGVEYVRGIQVVKIFGKQLDSFRTFFAAIENYSAKALGYSMNCRRPFVLFQVIFNMIIVVPLPFALWFLQEGAEASPMLAKLIFFACMAGVVFLCFMRIMFVNMHQMQAGMVVDSLEKTFAEMNEKQLSFGTLDRMENHDIEFCNVSFGYDDELLLKELNLKLPAGRTYALVGSSGGGKSTIAKLISGFYPLNAGEIRIGGRVLTDYSEACLMDNIAFVFQHSGLFKTSIYENVLMGKPQAERSEVLAALKAAQCDEILDKFPQREQTVIGAKGVHLSGGEQQRIAIARAILKDAPIIILDEASAATDPENEYELQKAFASLIAGKTVIMIAHRLSSIRRVDEILVIEQGEVIERGSHDALMEQRGKYHLLQGLYAQACDWRVYD